MTATADDQTVADVDADADADPRMLHCTVVDGWWLRSQCHDFVVLTACKIFGILIALYFLDASYTVEV